MQQKAFLAIFIVSIVSLFAVAVIYVNKDLTKYHYKIQIRRCYSQSIEVLEFETRGKESMISTYKEAVPVLYVGKKKIVDVCDYKILEQREIK